MRYRIFLAIGIILTAIFCYWQLSKPQVITVERELPSYYITQSIAETTTELTTEPQTEQYTATAYCPCEKCCDKWALNRKDGIVVGSSGIELEQGVSVASGLPAGTEIRVSDAGEYNGTYIVQDKPADWIIGKYNSKIIDFYFNEHADALEFGKRTITVEIIKGVTK